MKQIGYVSLRWPVLPSLLRHMFEVATEYDLIPANPVRKKLHRPRYKAKEKPHALSGLSYGLVPWILAVTGFRSQCCGLMTKVGTLNQDPGDW